jgi:hypothetical protein
MLESSLGRSLSSLDYTPMRVYLVLLIVATLRLLGCTCSAADDLSAFYASVRSVFIKHYPAAKASTQDETVIFDHETRLFMIHEPLKTGDWQDAREERGPKKGGIYCEIASERGAYKGAAVVPQTFDTRYFTVLILAPYSRRLDRHLHVRLSYPADASREFVREFTETASRFNDY